MSLTRDELLGRYRTMARIRAFELAARRLQAENRLWTETALLYALCRGLLSSPAEDEAYQPAMSSGHG